MSERKTEELFLKESKCVLGRNSFGNVFEQGEVESISAINDLLKKAGGKPVQCDLFDFEQGGSKKARPEYIITFDNEPQTIIVVECKKNIKAHASDRLNRPKDFAVDGVLYYAKFLKDGYNIVAIAMSGSKKEELKVSTFYWEKNAKSYTAYERLNVILEPENYLRFIKGDQISRDFSMDDIRFIASLMSNKLRVAKVTANDKPIFIAGILIALNDAAFAHDYSSITSLKLLVTAIEQSIQEVLLKANVHQDRIDNICHIFRKVAGLAHFKNTPMNEDYSLTWFVNQLDLKIRPMMLHANNSIDALGEFYSEFIKFSNGSNGKDLGIVLTPQHITDFMCELAGVNKCSRVIDICAGSGSFLVTAMSKMFDHANPNEMEEIREERLFGIEAEPDVYTLCLANMIVRHDGKSNMYYGSCFDDNDQVPFSQFKKKGIDVGLMNPPYSQEDHNEMQFVERLLSVLQSRGIGVVIVPINCALGSTCKEERERLMQNHTLKAVFSMPEDVFYPAAAAPPCIMVWEAGVPHHGKTFFGYYRDDGFIKKKNLGRIDSGRWEEIEREWLQLYRDLDVKAGRSVLEKVDASMEWVAEAYMSADYSKISLKDFERKVKEYIAFNYLNEAQ